MSPRCVPPLWIAHRETVTQTNAATAEESAAASEELNAQAEASLAAVNDIDALVGGSVKAVKPAAERRTSPTSSRFSLHKRAA